MVVPPPAECDTLIWLRPPPNDVADDDWQWYIDGSLLDEPRRFARRTGFAIVVVDSCTGQVAFGYGWPPAWVETAAAAEAWAYSFVVGLTPMAPTITTDCLEVLKTLSAGKRAAIAANVQASAGLGANVRHPRRTGGGEANMDASPRLLCHDQGGNQVQWPHHQWAGLESQSSR